MRGDFGKYDYKCPYYIVTFVMHEQKYPINEQVYTLDQYLSDMKIGIHAIHTAPLIRREKVYIDLDILERLKIFNTLFRFTRKVYIKYKNIIVEKKHKNTNGY